MLLYYAVFFLSGGPAVAQVIQHGNNTCISVVIIYLHMINLVMFLCTILILFMYGDHKVQAYSREEIHDSQCAGFDVRFNP